MEGVSGGATQHTDVALLLVDLQNAYFENPDLAAARARLIERTNRLIRVARGAGRPVILVRTVHAETGRPGL